MNSIYWPDHRIFYGMTTLRYSSYLCTRTHLWTSCFIANCEISYPMPVNFTNLWRSSSIHGERNRLFIVHSIGIMVKMVISKMKYRIYYSTLKKHTHHKKKYQVHNLHELLAFRMNELYFSILQPQQVTSFPQKL